MGTHGASKKAVKPCVAMKLWIWEMSREARPLKDRLAGAHATAQARYAGPSCSFSQQPTRIVIAVRKASSAHIGQRNGRDQRERRPARPAAGGQHAVVDLQHVDRQGQHEHVDGEAEYRACGESRAASRNRSLEFRRAARPASLSADFSGMISPLARAAMTRRAQAGVAGVSSSRTI